MEQLKGSVTFLREEMRSICQRLNSKNLTAKTPRSQRIKRGSSMIQVKPYCWEGPYAEMRASTGSYHDVGLCAKVRADWMELGERIIFLTIHDFLPL